MREIKFRAWDDGAKKWLMGYEMPNLGGFSLFGEMVLLGEWSAILDQFLFDRNGHKTDDMKVMQFTGLKDNHGKEIYEGDIVTFGEGRNFRVVWALKYGSWYVSPCGYYENDAPLGKSEMACKVIGNIYENPELLK